jgi:hypothetical protein
MQTKLGSRVAVWAVAAAAGMTIAASSASAGVIFGFTGSTLGGGSRWDAAPRTISGNERSLQGGLRYSLQGGSFQAYRDLFSWSGTPPTVPQFTTAVQQAFDAWSSVDPVSGLGTQLSFVPDLATPVAGVVGGGNNPNGAEIDLFGVNDASFWNPGDNGTQGEAWFGTVGSTVTLTSGTANYPGSFAISGADVYINNNPGAVYTLDLFRRLLTHELGHTLGLGDVEGSISPGRFIDDNYDPTNAATVVATLNNSWALMVNPLNPGASAGLSRFTVNTTATAGVDILMESQGLGISAGNPMTNLVPLTNDDYGTRQFLYPAFIPEPAVLGAMSFIAGLLVRRRR